MSTQSHEQHIQDPQDSQQTPIQSSHPKRGLIFLAILIIVGLSYWLISRSYTAPTAEPANDDEPAQTTPAVSPAQEIQKESIKDTGDGYTINVVYPRTQSPAVTKYMSDFVNNAIEEFKNDTAWLNDPSIPKSEATTSLTIDYTAQTTDKVITYTFSTTSYTGGAHGMSVTTTFNFNKTSGERYTLGNIFTNETEGLKALAAYVMNELKKRNISDSEWISDGAGPNKDNYQNFAFTEEGINVFFDPYQVAAYAAGPQTVTVPYSALKSVLIPDLQ